MIFKALIFLNFLLTFFDKNVFMMQIVHDRGSDGFDYVNTELVNKSDTRWDTRKLIMCTNCTLAPGTIVAFQAYFRNAIAVKPLQFSLWTPDLQGMALLQPGSKTKIYTLLLNIDYDPSTLGRDNSVGCNNGIHTIIIPPGNMRTVNGSAVIGVIVQPSASIVYNFNMDPEGSGLTDQLRYYENLFDNMRLSPGESRQFGNLAVAEEIAFGAITYPVPDLPIEEQTRIANALAKAKNCSGSNLGPTTVPPPDNTTPAPSGPSIDEIERGPPPPPNPDGWNLGNDASCNVPVSSAIRSLAEPPQEPQMKIFIFAALNLPTGVVNGFQVCVGREVRYPGEGFRFQVWRRVNAKFSTDGGVSTRSTPGTFFRLIGQSKKFTPNNKTSYTYLLEAKERFNVSAGDYFGFVNYGNETLISSTKVTKNDISAAIAFYELGNLQQALLVGETYKFDEALQFNRYAASILMNASTTDPMARTPFDGPSGEPGPAGPTGIIGASGLKGDTGDIGPKGPKGDQGPPGYSGASMGPKGDQGPTGPPGPDSTVKGPKGPQGKNGTKGARGEPGLAGLPGKTGKDGITGPVGPRGERGPVGQANNEAVNITTCKDGEGANLTCAASTGGQCLVIDRYRVNITQQSFANSTIQGVQLPTKFEQSETVCRCAAGYEFKSGQCVNVNECGVSNGGCEYVCVDSDGSYTCKCPSGLQLSKDGHRCDDLDECQPVNPCRQGDTCLNRYKATEALCLHVTDHGIPGEQGKQQDRPIATSDSVFYKRETYIGMLIWLSALSVILIICIVLLAVFWPQMGRDNEEDNGSLKSYDIPTTIDQKGAGAGASTSPPMPDWAAEMKEDTYMQERGDIHPQSECY